MGVRAVRSLVQSRRRPAIRVASTQPLLKIPLAVYNEIKEHALIDAPRECCGFLSTRDAEAMSVHRGTNIAENPHKGFLMDTEEVEEILNQIDLMDGEPGAVYHSHPVSLASPSPADVRSAWPTAITIIIGMGQGLTMRGFEIIHGYVREIRLEIV